MQQRADGFRFTTAIAVLVSLASFGSESAACMDVRGLSYYSYVFVVEVPLIAWNERNELVLDLAREELAVADNGVPVMIESLLTCPYRDLWVVLMMDSSKSVKNYFWSMQRAAFELVELLPGYARISLLEFNDTVTELADFTMDAERIVRAVDGIAPDGNTDLCRALDPAIAKLFDKTGKKVIFLFSDGFDKQAETERNRIPGPILRAAKRAASYDIVIYCLTQGYPVNRTIMETIARLGGGYCRHLSERGLKQELQHMVCEVAPSHIALYDAPVLEFDGKWREISVSCARDNLTLAHKRGYYLHLDQQRKTIPIE